MIVVWAENEPSGVVEILEKKRKVLKEHEEK